MFYHRRVGLQWIDRGDVAAVDYNVSSLTADDDWHDLDISSIVGATKKLVVIESNLKDNTGGKEMLVRTKGNVNEINVSPCGTVKADKTCARNLLVYTDENGVVQYKIESGTWAIINLVIRGWFA
ncbi:unnamed protein product [marine sediment metagenome]|uniref:Uncharacterized protein n=1 Tax=marine sediment metagenome TaxID=412755 RepID=X1RL19_9ZZZZ